MSTPFLRSRIFKGTSTGIVHVIKHTYLHRVHTRWGSLENLTIDEKFINKRVRLFVHQTMCFFKKCWEEKKYSFKNLLTFTPLRNGCLITFEKMQKQPPKKFCEKSVLNNFAIFTGKHLCLSLFLRGESHIDFCTHCIIMTLAGGRLLVMTFWKWEKLSNIQVLELSFIAKFIFVFCYNPSVQVKYQS